MTPVSETGVACDSDKNENATSTSNNDSDTTPNKQVKTVVVEPPKGHGATYVRCHSQEEFAHPEQTTNNNNRQLMSAKDINQTLRLNLGLSALLNPDNVYLRRFLRFLHVYLLMWWEGYFFQAYDRLPLKIRRRITFGAWALYLPLHRYWLGRSTGIHPDVSYEYHALTTVMWWGRLFPVSIERMRFALSQLSVCALPPPAPPPAPSTIQSSESSSSNTASSRSSQSEESTVSEVTHDMKEYLSNHKVVHNEPTLVTGYYVQADAARPSDKVIFWLYGGAYLAGDAKGNTVHAESVARTCHVDIFLPNFRLMPEYDYDEILWDVVLAYMYLVHTRGMDPANILLLGVSSGGGIATRVLQAVAELNRKKRNNNNNNQEEEIFDNSEAIESLLLSSSFNNKLMPAGAVLMCPFVDYTDPEGSFKEYPAHDLVVNQSVIEVGVPFLEIKLGSDENRRRTSPVYRSFQGLPPLCVVVSEHEVVYDQTIELVNRARSEGVAVTFGVWKYMCHVFCFFSSFCPEGQQSMDFVCDWICQQNKTKKSNNKNKEE